MEREGSEFHPVVVLVELAEDSGLQGHDPDEVLRVRQPHESTLRNVASSASSGTGGNSRGQTQSGVAVVGDGLDVDLGSTTCSRGLQEESAVTVIVGSGDGATSHELGVDVLSDLVDKAHTGGKRDGNGTDVVDVESDRVVGARGDLERIELSAQHRSAGSSRDRQGLVVGDERDGPNGQAEQAVDDTRDVGLVTTSGSASTVQVDVVDQGVGVDHPGKARIDLEVGWHRAERSAEHLAGDLGRAGVHDVNVVGLYVPTLVVTEQVTHGGVDCGVRGWVALDSQVLEVRPHTLSHGAHDGIFEAIALDVFEQGLTSDVPVGPELRGCDVDTVQLGLDQSQRQSVLRRTCGDRLTDVKPVDRAPQVVERLEPNHAEHSGVLPDELDELLLALGVESTTETKVASLDRLQEHVSVVLHDYSSLLVWAFRLSRSALIEPNAPAKPFFTGFSDGSSSETDGGIC